MLGSLRQRVSRRQTSTGNKPPTLTVTEVSESESSTTPDPDFQVKGRLQKKKPVRRSLHIHAQEAGVSKVQNQRKCTHLNFGPHQSVPSTLSGDSCFLWVCCVRTMGCVGGKEK